MKMNWVQLFSSSFLFFHRFLLQKERTCYHFIDCVRVRVLAEADLKDSFIFLRLNF